MALLMALNLLVPLCLVWGMGLLPTLVTTYLILTSQAVFVQQSTLIAEIRTQFKCLMVVPILDTHDIQDGPLILAIIEDVTQDIEGLCIDATGDSK